VVPKTPPPAQAENPVPACALQLRRAGLTRPALSRLLFLR
jgi:hypothetical protein